MARLPHASIIAPAPHTCLSCGTAKCSSSDLAALLLRHPLADQITFGSVTAEEVNDEADVFVLIAPQNIVGYSILPFLQGEGVSGCACTCPVG